MELELVSVEYTIQNNVRVRSLVLVEGGTDLAAVVQILLRLYKNSLYGVEDAQEVGRVLFHAEDAYVLGLKVGGVI